MSKKEETSEEKEIEVEEEPLPPSRRRGAEISPTLQLIEAIRSGQADPISAAFAMGELKRIQWEEEDRREERRLRKQQAFQPQQPLTIESITAAFVKALQEAGITKTETPKEEMPEWAKEIRTQQQEILERLAKEEQEKRERELIEKATEPFKAELAKKTEELEAVRTELKEVRARVESPPEPPKDKLDVWAETDALLEKRGLKPKPTIQVPSGKLTPERVRLAMGQAVLTQLTEIANTLINKLGFAEQVVDRMLQNQRIQTLVALEQAYGMAPGTLVIPAIRAEAEASTIPPPPKTTPKERKQLVEKMKKLAEAEAA